MASGACLIRQMDLETLAIGKRLLIGDRRQRSIDPGGRRRDGLAQEMFADVKATFCGRRFLGFRSKCEESSLTEDSGTLGIVAKIDFVPDLGRSFGAIDSG